MKPQAIISRVINGTRVIGGGLDDVGVTVFKALKKILQGYMVSTPMRGDAECLGVRVCGCSGLGFRHVGLGVSWCGA